MSAHGKLRLWFSCAMLWHNDHNRVLSKRLSYRTNLIIRLFCVTKLQTDLLSGILWSKILILRNIPPANWFLLQKENSQWTTYGNKLDTCISSNQTQRIHDYSQALLVASFFLRNCPLWSNSIYKKNRLWNAIKFCTKFLETRESFYTNRVTKHQLAIASSLHKLWLIFFYIFKS